MSGSAEQPPPTFLTSWASVTSRLQAQLQYALRYGSPNTLNLIADFDVDWSHCWPPLYLHPEPRLDPSAPVTHL